MTFIHRPGDSPRDTRLGGKAGSLAQLHGAGFVIPVWFVVLPEALETCLAQTGGRVSSTKDPVAEGEFRLEQIRLFPKLLDELAKALAEICPAGELVAVRSSALDEDSRDLSFAGQLESFLFVPLEDVPGKIIEVWKSTFGSRALAYRRLHGLANPPPAPAVLVQRMVHADVSGVAFGADPLKGRRDLAVVASIYGPGSALVGGESDADTWQIDARENIVTRQIAHKPWIYRFEAGQLRRMSLTHETPDGPTMEDEQIRAVAALVRRAGTIFGQPQDIEWALAGGQLFLLQSRPITWRGQARADEGRVNIWDNSNIIESYSGVTTPLTFSFARRAYEGVYREFCVLLSVPKAKIAANEQAFRQLLGLIRGRVYYNLLNWYRVLSLLPGFTINRRFMEQMMGVKEELPREIVTQLSQAGMGARLKDGFDLGVMGAALCLNHFLLPRKIRQFRARLEDALEPPTKPLESMDTAELSDYFLSLQKRLLTHWDAPLLNDFFAMIFHGVLKHLAAAWVDDAEGTLPNNLLCSGGGMISAEPAQRVRDLARIAATNPDFTNMLCAAPLPDILSATEKFTEFKTELKNYLKKFGERCLEELKLESLTLHDDPLFLLRCVGQLARNASASNGYIPMTGETDVRQQAAKRVSLALAGHPSRRAIFAWVLRHARGRVRDRENLRFERTRLFARVRQVFLQLGQRLHDQGHLSDPREVFYLEIDEVLGFIAGTTVTTRLQKLATLRKSEFAEYRASAAPPSRFETHGIVSQGLPFAVTLPSGKDAGDEERKGIGCCPGAVRGPVRIVFDPRKAVIQPGDILVAERTDPGWVVLFPSAAGLLVERGSLLSHSAIVAREMGLPAVVSISGLTSWLRDGDRVEFDGSTGVVRRIEKAKAIPGGSPALNPSNRPQKFYLNNDQGIPTPIAP